MAAQPPGGRAGILSCCHTHRWGTQHQHPGDFLLVETGEGAKGSLTLKVDTGKASSPWPPVVSPPRSPPLKEG